MKIVTYNIHKGMDKDNRITLDLILKYLSNNDFDIICLQEVLYSQFIIIKNKLMYDGVFATNVDKPMFKYGICTFTKNEVINSKHIFLTSKKEQRGLLHINTRNNENNFEIINTHLGLDIEERIIQIDEILNYMSTLENYKILCGDFNEKNIMISQYYDSAIINNNYNIETLINTTARIDYIFIDKKIKSCSNYVDKINYSDHYPVVTTFDKM